MTYMTKTPMRNTLTITVKANETCIVQLLSCREAT